MDKNAFESYKQAQDACKKLKGILAVVDSYEISGLLITKLDEKKSKLTMKCRYEKKFDE